MALYSKYILPKLVNCACGLKPMRKQREKIIPQATGDILEIGLGSGLNLPFYNQSNIQHFYGLEPGEEMWDLVDPEAMDEFSHFEKIVSGAENIPLDNESVDTVVCTYTLCTIPDWDLALQEIKRVLRPSGQLLFCEHGKAPDLNVQKTQNRVNPIWKKIAGGCNLNRDIIPKITSSGFDISDQDKMYVPGWKPACFNVWGRAQPMA